MTLIIEKSQEAKGILRQATFEGAVVCQTDVRRASLGIIRRRVG